MKKKVSVIVPVYKVEAYLRRCIDSIINQTYENLEIILIDDESPDKCGEICDEYAIKDDRIIVIHQKNRGPSCARNTGLDIMTGDYITYVDSDDHLDLLMIEKMMYHVLKHDLDVLEILPDNINKNTKIDDALVIEDPIEASKRIFKTYVFSVWRRIFKKSFVKDLRFIPGLIHQDVFYTVDILKKLPNYGYLRSLLYFYNIDSISIIRSKYSLEKINVGIRATEYIINNHLPHPEITEIVNDYVSSYYIDHYLLLSRNTHVDPDKVYRKKLRKEIKNRTKYKNYSLKVVLVITMPYKMMEYISSNYNALALR